MAIILGLLLFGMYFFVYVASVMIYENTKYLQLLIYGISTLIFLMTYIFISKDFSTLQNYLFILLLGFTGFSWLSIKSFWKRPYKVKVDSLTAVNNILISEEDYNEVVRINNKLESANYRGIASCIISIICMIAMKSKASTHIQVDDLLDGMLTMGLMLGALTIVYLIVDIILAINRKKFAFLFIRPFGTLMWLIICTIFA